MRFCVFLLNQASKKEKAIGNYSVVWRLAFRDTFLRVRGALETTAARESASTSAGELTPKGSPWQ